MAIAIFASPIMHFGRAIETVVFFPLFSVTYLLRDRFGVRGRSKSYRELRPI